MPTAHRSWLEVSSSALRHNLRISQRLVGRSVSIIPVVKANAYGHGMPTVLSALRPKPKLIGVAYGEEALAFRQTGYRGRILVMSHWSPRELPALVKQSCDVVVWDTNSLRAVQRLPLTLRQQARLHLKLDSGTSRIGWLPTALPQLDRATKDLNVVAAFSHLANAEERSLKRTNQQINCFATLSKPWAHQRGILLHLACTAAAWRYPEARFGAIRLGIGLYGLWPSTEIRAAIRAKYRWFNLQPVLSWYTTLEQVKTVPAGTGIGYGSSILVRRPTRIGILPVGYADGYDRRLSNHGWVMVHGHRAPILGRICMNLMMVDLTAIPRAAVGDRVTLIGAGMTAETMADLCSTLHYEVTTRINWSLPRILI